jgi:hypothetical protein
MTPRIRSAIFVLLATTLLLAAQESLIPTLTSGVLTWSNAVPNAQYRIEWSAGPGKPWRVDSPFGMLTATGYAASAEVPLLYRVVYLGSGGSITGTVFYSVHPVSSHVVTLKNNSFATLTSTTSDVSGAYAFTGLTNGTYMVGTETSPTYRGYFYSATINGDRITRDIYLTRNLQMLVPPNGATVTVTSPDFSWEAPPEAVRYTFQLMAQDTFTTVDFANNVLTNQYQTTALLSNGVTYSWSVNAYDGSDLRIGSVSFCMFTVRLP